MSDWRSIVGHDFTAEDFAAMDRGSERLVMEARTLSEIRKLEHITQTELAARLGVTQGAIAQAEGKGDMRVSALRQLVESMGGSVKIIAEMPGKSPVCISGL